MFWEIILPILRSTRLCVTLCGIMHPRCCRPVAGNIVIKYIKSVLWRVAKPLSYIEEARCLKVNDTSHLQPINHKNQSVSCYTLVNRMLTLGYLHVTFPWMGKSHLAISELLHTTKLKRNNCAFSIRERNHIHIHPKVSITSVLTLNSIYY